MANTNTVLVLLNDLLFQVKIAEAAKHAGLKAVFVQSMQALRQAQAQHQPTVMILDLNFAAVDPLGTIRELKADTGTKGVPLLGYVSHVQVDLRSAAVEAGCDVVLARSAFVQNLAELLGRYITPEELASDRL